MEEADQYRKSHDEGEVTPPPSVDDVENASDEEDTTQCRASGKVWFLGLIAFLSITASAVAAGVVLSRGGDNEVSVPTSEPSGPTSEPSDPTSEPSDPPSDPLDMEPLAKVVLPGVDIFHLNRTAPQYRALEFLTYHDSRFLTIEDDSIELLERFSMATLYFASGGEYGHSGWLNSSSHCTWKLWTECDENGRITVLDFYDSGFFNIGATLPPEIGNFQNARELDFMGNYLEGSIPTEIGLLTSIESLTLSYNWFEGTLPTEIGTSTVWCT
eukprot:scaffold6106_cov103-Cylindrotheca_fusiformis.AAC.1